MAGAVATIEALAPIKVRFRDEQIEVVLRPGERADLPQPLAERLVKASPGKARIVSDHPGHLIPWHPCPSCGQRSWWHDLDADRWCCRTCAPPSPGQDPRAKMVESAPSQPPEASAVLEPGPGRAVCWESADGIIRQGVAELLGRSGQEFWIGVRDPDGAFAWVRDARLRSKLEFERQAQEGRTRCAACGGRPPLTWRTGWLVCPACEDAR